MLSGKTGVPGLVARVTRLFPEREIFLRSGGTVRFLKVSSRLQMTVAGAVALLLLGWAAATIAMFVRQYDIAHDRALLEQRQAAIASSARKVSKYRASVNDIAEDLQQRQDNLEELVKSHFGALPGDAAGERAADPKPAAKPTKISAAIPGPEALRALEAKQIAFAQDLTQAVAARTRKVEAAIRSVGLNPSSMLRQGRAAQGGPFIPYRAGMPDEIDPQFATLARALDRLDMLEGTLLSIPSGRPTTALMLSSPFGYRSDPINGRAAFHPGLDFRGAYGQPILAAANGRVSYVGQIRGYGNVVEVNHGHGILTRYAHLSGFNARVGQKVRRGQQIARMGSTGRSTGTHLHFEVRLNGQPINPRRFLEANADVLKIQKVATERFDDARNRG